MPPGSDFIISRAGNNQPSWGTQIGCKLPGSRNPLALAFCMAGTRDLCAWVSCDFPSLVSVPGSTAPQRTEGLRFLLRSLEAQEGRGQAGWASGDIPPLPCRCLCLTWFLWVGPLCTLNHFLVLPTNRSPWGLVFFHWVWD